MFFNILSSDHTVELQWLEQAWAHGNKFQPSRVDYA